MRPTREHLRRASIVALDNQKYSDIVVESGPGIVPGARLKAFKSGKGFDVAVRTSMDREIGLLQTRSGKLRTVPNMDLVLAAVPAEDLLGAEVFAFEPVKLTKLFYKELERAQQRSFKKESKSDPTESWKIPIFLKLDDTKKRGDNAVQPGVKVHAEWRELIPFTHPDVAEPSPNPAPGEPAASLSPEQLTQALRRAVAKRLELDPSRVVVRVEVVPLGDPRDPMA